jgi:hypothetical protein
MSQEIFLTFIENLWMYYMYCTVNTVCVNTETVKIYENILKIQKLHLDSLQQTVCSYVLLT